ncbi:MAG: hypothetical protein EOP87_26670, partial [Verrucomicrobiaceae bacterium]
MKASLSLLMPAAAGFLAGWLVMSAFRGDPQPAASGNNRAPGRRHGETLRPWLDPKIGASDRMARFIDHTAELTATEWPDFFKSLRNAPEWSRLAANQWARQDPSGFWSYLRGEHDPDLLAGLGADLVMTWAEMDPDAAMDAAIEVTDKTAGEALRTKLVDSVLERDLSKGLELAARAGDFNNFSTGERKWIDRDPGAAVRGLATLPEFCDYHAFLGVALRVWAKQDPDAALAWMKTDSKGSMDTPRGLSMLSSAFSEVARTDSRLALEAARSLES